MVVSIPLQIARREIKPGVVVLELTGRLLAGPDTTRIGQEVEQLLSRNEKWLILDFSKLSFVDSSGLGEVVKCFSKLKKSGGSLRLAGVQGMIATVIKITQVDKLIEIFPTAADAAGNFSPEVRE